MTFKNPSRRAALYALPALAAAPMASSAAIASVTTDPAPTHLEALHARYLDALRDVEAMEAPTDAEIDRRVQRANDLQAQMIAATPQTPADVARVVLTFREYLDNNGALPARMVALLDRIANA